MPVKPRVDGFSYRAPRARGEGLRIGVTRMPPRGVPRERWAAEGWFDVWLPAVAPSLALVKRGHALDWGDPAARARFFAAYERELAAPQARQVIELLAAVARRTPISLGCACADESLCHRQVLLRLVRAAAGAAPRRAATAQRTRTKRRVSTAPAARTRRK